MTTTGRKPMTTASSTVRTQRCRQRKRQGKAVLPVPVDLERLRNVLVSANLLKQWDEDDRQATIAAFARAVELWVTREERKLAITTDGV